MTSIKKAIDYARFAQAVKDGFPQYAKTGMTKKDVKKELTGIGFPKFAIKEFWNSCDPNNDGRIPVGVFRGALILLYKCPRAAKARFLFRCFDEEKKGVIKKKDCKKMFFTLYWTGFKLVDTFVPLPLGSGLVGRMIVSDWAKKAASACDSDNDGLVSEQNLIDFMKNEKLPDWAIAMQEEIDKVVDKECPELPDDVKAQFLLEGETIEDVATGQPRGGIAGFAKTKALEAKDSAVGVKNDVVAGVATTVGSVASTFSKGLGAFKF